MNDKKRALLQKLMKQKGVNLGTKPQIGQRPDSDKVALSFAQQQLWFLSQLNPDSHEYNLGTAFRLEGRFDQQAFEQAWQMLVAEQCVMRIYFEQAQGQIWQRVQRDIDLPFVVEDLTALDETAQQQRLAQLTEQGHRRTFALDSGPLFHIHLVKLAARTSVILFHIHHIITDGLSLDLLVETFTRYYLALLSNETPQSTVPTPDYLDFCYWQRQTYQGEKLLELDNFWLQKLAGMQPLNTLPTDFARPSTRQGKGAVHRITTDYDLNNIGNHTIAKQINAVANAHRCTPFILLQTVWSCFISLYANTNDVVLGSPVSGRILAELGKMQGFLANVVVFRHRIDNTKSFADILAEQRQTVLDCLANQAIPFDRLVDKIGHQRDLSRTPLYQLSFALQQGEVIEQSLGEITITREPMTQNIAQCDLSLFAYDVGKYFAFEWQYDTALFSFETIKRIEGMFMGLLQSVMDNPQQRLSELSLVSDSMRDTLLSQWNRAAPLTPASGVDNTLHQLFERQVLAHPNQIALVDEHQQLSYQQLNQQANQLAHVIVHKYPDLAADSLIGIYLNRGVQQVISILAVLKAGGAYVPLSAQYPQQRTEFIIADSGMKLLITEQQLAEQLRDIPMVNNAECGLLIGDDSQLLSEQPITDLAASSTATDLAYLIYTSGTTGEPKGVLQPHHNVVRLFDTTAADFQFGAEDVWTLYHAITFDFSVWELWGALLHGGRLIIPNEQCIRDFADFVDLCAQHQVTVLNQTPVAFYAFIDQALKHNVALPSLRYVIFGGDKLNLTQLQPWWLAHGDQRPQLVNMYGITETTVHVTYKPLSLADHQNISTIGKPLNDLLIYVLNEQLDLVPIGTPGELFVGGAGLARGYHNREQLTKARFIANPYASGQDDVADQRLYKTGDVVRWCANGELEYLGRNDFQVKIRGYRIELGEIESALAALPGVKQAVVIDREQQGNKYLSAYIVPESTPEAISPERLKEQLLNNLPNYMVPSSYTLLESLPLTLNGKLDRQALPQAEFISTEVYVAPVSQQEKALCQLWQEILAVAQVGVNDNFFALGGDSIVSLQLVSAAAGQQIYFTVQDLFIAQTISGLIPLLSLTGQQNHSVAPFALIDHDVVAKLPAGVVDAYPATRLQLGMLFHHQLSDNKETYHNVCTFYMPFQPQLSCLQAAVDQVISEHQVLRTQFNFDLSDEPLQLVYESVAGGVLFEDISALADPQQALAEWQRKETSTDLDLSAKSLFKLVMFKLDEQAFQVGYSGHHAIMDGWSLAKMLEQVAECYQQLIAGKQPQHQQFQLRFADYVAAERQVQATQAQHDFWRDELKNASFTRLPRMPGTNRAGDHQVHQLHIGRDTMSQLVTLARQQGVSMKTVVMAAHLRVISYISGSHNTLTGLVSNGRLEHPDATRVLGLYLNSIVWHQRFDQGHNWLDSLAQISRQEAELLPYSRFPLSQLIKENDQQELFEVLFNYISYEGLCGDEQQDSALHTLGVVNYPLLVNCVFDPLNVKMTLNLSCDLNHLQLDQVKRYGDYYQRALLSMIAQPLQPFAEHQLADSAEINLTHAPVIDLPASGHTDHLLCLDQKILALGAEFDHKNAVIFGQRSLSYGQLKTRATALAWHIQQHGVKANQLVAIDCADGIAQVIAMLGCSIAGVAYLPLDPGWPRSRKDKIIRRGEVNLLLMVSDSDKALVADLPEVTVLGIGDNESIWTLASSQPIVQAGPDDLAYVIFTSGSTGEPKGVMLRHSAVQNTFDDMVERYQVSADDVVLGLSSIAFDLSVYDVFGLLQQGGTLVLPDADKRQAPDHWSELVTEHQVTLWNSVPAIFQLWLDYEDNGASEDDGESRVINDSLRHVLLSGDWLPLTLQPQAARLVPGADIHSLGGATEAAIWSITYPIQQIEPDWVSVPYGKAMHNQSFHVLNQAMQTCPIGTQGDLYIGGVGLADGYFKDPQRTASSFIYHPRSGERLYKTGDLGRFLADGNIEFLGRADFQVQVNGYRVELGEIEAVLDQHQQIKSTLVALQQDPQGHSHLVAYVICQPDSDVDAAATSAWQQHLAEHLPHYMVPQHYYPLANWPLSENGKVDRKALPLPVFGAQSDSAAVASEPKNDCEQQLLTIMARLLSRENLSLTDDFFMAGMDSIAAIQLVAQAKRKGIHFSIQAVYQNPSLRELAKVAQMQAKQATQSGEFSSSELLPIQRWFVDRFVDQLDNRLDNNYGAAAHHFNQAFGFSVNQLNREYLSTTVAQLLKAHPLLRARLSDSGQQLEVQPLSVVLDQSLNHHQIEGTSEIAEQIEQLAQQAQQSLHLQQGPLVRFVHITIPAVAQQRLLVICHHMVIDGVSWRIILDDFNHVYAALVAGQPVELAASESGFDRWAAHLREQAKLPALSAELDYWRSQMGASGLLDPAIEAAFDSSVNHYADSQIHESRLEVELTTCLLSDANQSHNTDIQDMLLTGLALALAKISGLARFSVMLEGHGRHTAATADAAGDSDSFDLSRTVGWFTQLYPVLLDASDGQPLNSLIRVKENLRQLPQQGRGYGLLRHLNGALAEQTEPALWFNYLGNVDGSISTEGYLQVAAERLGEDIAATLPRPNLIEINTMISAGQLQISCRYHPKCHDSELISRFMQQFEQQLQQLAHSCTAQSERQFTPSDVADTGMDSDEINDFLDDLCQ